MGPRDPLGIGDFVVHQDRERAIAVIVGSETVADADEAGCAPTHFRDGLAITYSKE